MKTREATTLAVVSYLNAKPLIEGLEGRFRLIEAVPAECWELVHSGRADLGLIPSIGLGEDPELAIVPGVAIAAEGPVRSVVLITRGPFEDIRSVAVDESSRAAAALLRVLCSRRFDVGPRFVSAPPDWQAMLEQHDAALLIGDPALGLAEDERFYERRDLKLIDIGDEWTRWTGLPFVFAVWAGKAERLSPELVAALQEARDRGVGRLEAIAGAAAQNSAQASRNLSYLREAIRYELGEREIAGLRRFLDLAGELHLLAGGRSAPAELTLAGTAPSEPVAKS
jgi:chorismate dehydratase